jgi:hypothetical protein
MRIERCWTDSGCTASSETELDWKTSGERDSPERSNGSIGSEVADSGGDPSSGLSAAKVSGSVAVHWLRRRDRKATPGQWKAKIQKFNSRSRLGRDPT